MMQLVELALRTVTTTRGVPGGATIPVNEVEVTAG